MQNTSKVFLLETYFTPPQIHGLQQQSFQFIPQTIPLNHGKLCQYHNIFLKPKIAVICALHVFKAISVAFIPILLPNLLKQQSFSRGFFGLNLRFVFMVETLCDVNMKLA
jgi:hypothetical protein